MEDLVAQLKTAIDRNDFDQVRELMTFHPQLHEAPLGYGGDGALTWVAECRVPREAPGPARLAIAKWMIENGSDVHQGGDGPLGRAALDAERIAMMNLLVQHGADVNASWHGFSPVIFSPCETLDPVVLSWLLEHGAEPNLQPKTALDYLLGAYLRDTETLRECIEILLRHGGTTSYDLPGVLDILRGKYDALLQKLEADPDLLHRRFAELDFGTTAARNLTLRGGTLLHVAAEFGDATAARLLLDQGADVNARALFDDAKGTGGQTPLFHAATQNHDFGYEVVELLLERGADVSVQARVPGYYERPEEVLECTAVEYAALFPPGGTGRTAARLRAYGIR